MTSTTTGNQSSATPTSVNPMAMLLYSALNAELNTFFELHNVSEPERGTLTRQAVDRLFEQLDQRSSESPIPRTPPSVAIASIPVAHDATIYNGDSPAPPTSGYTYSDTSNAPGVDTDAPAFAGTDTSTSESDNHSRSIGSDPTGQGLSTDTHGAADTRPVEIIPPSMADDAFPSDGSTLLGSNSDKKKKTDKGKGKKIAPDLRPLEQAANIHTTKKRIRALEDHDGPARRTRSRVSASLDPGSSGSSMSHHQDLYVPSPPPTYIEIPPHSVPHLSPHSDTTLGPSRFSLKRHLGQPLHREYAFYIPKDEALPIQSLLAVTHGTLPAQSSLSIASTNSSVIDTISALGSIPPASNPLSTPAAAPTSTSAGPVALSARTSAPASSGSSSSSSSRKRAREVGGEEAGGEHTEDEAPPSRRRHRHD